MTNAIIHLNFFFVLALSFPAFTQNSFVASGSSTSTSAGEISTSIGLVAYVSDSSFAGSVSEGNQQTYDIIDGIIQIPLDGYEVKVFPNPFPGNVYIAIVGEKTETIEVELYGPNGMLLKKETFCTPNYCLKTENLVPGSYIILIRSKNFEPRRYKLIKNK